MATAEDAARWIAFESEDHDSFGGEKGNGWARATTDDVAAGLGIDTEVAYRLLKSAARKGLVIQDKARRKGVTTKRYGESQVGWAIWEVHLDDEQTREFERRQLQPNASYYVWVLAPHSDAPLSSEGPYGPHPLKRAEQMARIGATEGIHDRAVSLGRDPEAHGFRIERRYQARSGKRIV